MPVSDTTVEPQKDRRSIIGVTVGDPAGIGPEVAVKALDGAGLLDVCWPVLIGDIADIDRTIGQLGLKRRCVEFTMGKRSSGNTVEVIHVKGCEGKFEFGVESAATGSASAANIEAAVELINNGTIDAVATAPISKNALQLASVDFPGHTEYFAALTGTSKFAMSFFAEKLRVVLLTTHVSLRAAIEAVKEQSLVDLITFADETLPAFIGARPRIAVAGLNPHASEQGMFGDEEAREISPAIETCRSKGIDVSGPFSPDTIFLRGFKGEFDLVVACYHDQATIAVKSLSFGSSVNVTLGLPIIRTSVDHGTAFDIAGKGIADESSMQAAIKLAAEFVNIDRSKGSGKAVS